LGKHFAKRRPTAFETNGVDVGDVVTDDVHHQLVISKSGDSREK
jgi:hypothetical protein